MDNCACAWGPEALSAGPNRDSWKDWQIAWCRLHMEAEIAKQGQAAGAVASTANPNVDGAQTGSGTAKKVGLGSGGGVV